MRVKGECHRMTNSNAKVNTHAEVRQLLREAGVYDKQTGYYARLVCGIVSLFVLGIVGIILTHNILPLLLLVAVFRAFVDTQLGFIAHDAVHEQITNSPRINRFIALFCGCLMWLSPSWWCQKHNLLHHLNPNHFGKDRDTDISIIGLSELQALNKTGIARFMVKNQAWFFLPVLFVFEAVSIRSDSLQHLILSPFTKKEVKYPLIELVSFFVHPLVYFGLLFWLIDPWQHVVLFIIVHQGCLGVYLGLVFATNHKGMPMTDGTEQWDSLLRQVLPTRNVTGGWLIDFIMGGLNLQIPHHIDSLIPRCNLKRANEICRNFCKAHGITYCEESVWKSYYLIFAFLHQISSVLRKKPVAS